MRVVNLPLSTTEDRLIGSLDIEQVLQEGIKKLFNILKQDGIFILKWCDTDRPVDEIIKLCPYKPMVGTRTGQGNKNHWILFIKHRFEKKLIEYDET